MQIDHESIAWQNFELEVYEHMKKKVAGYKSTLSPRSAEVYHKKGYFSKDRNSEIIFDVSMEEFEAGASQFSFLHLFECKDYPNRKVKVDEVEEFWSKMQQVAAHKGHIFTRVGFESGCIEFAKSKRIGLSVLSKGIEERIAYAKTAPTVRIQVMRLVSGVLTSGHEISPKDALDIDAIIQIGIFNHS